MKTAIQRKARELGFDDCRVSNTRAPDHATAFEKWLAEGRHGEMGYLARNAAKRVDPAQVLAGARSVITLAVTYHRGDANDGAIARYARYADYHEIMGERLRLLADFVNSTAGEACRSLWYVDTGPLLERDLAQRAGLGFIGKHTNLISRRLGNWIFLGEIITTLELEPDAPERNHCGTCRRCLEACPTGALTGPFAMDARLCISYLTIELKGSIPEALRPAIGARIYGCDDCLAVCPWNRFAKEGALMRPHFRPQFETPDLIELLSLDEAGFRRRFGATPMRRTKRRGLLRNVCVALGNSGDRRALPALARAADDPEPLIAEHAQWALKRLEGPAQRS